MTDGPILFLLLGGIVLGLAAWAGWTAGARRKRRTAPVLDQKWLCEACHSFNEPLREACYSCRRPRPSEARVVAPDRPFRIQQQFGRAKGGPGRGRSRPWLGAEEPLLEPWLSTHPGADPEATPRDGDPPAAGADPDR